MSLDADFAAPPMFRDADLAHELTRLIERAMEAQELEVAELLLDALRMLSAETAAD